MSFQAETKIRFLSDFRTKLSQIKMYVNNVSIHVKLLFSFHKRTYIPTKTLMRMSVLCAWLLFLFLKKKIQAFIQIFIDEKICTGLKMVNI